MYNFCKKILFVLLALSFNQNILCADNVTVSAAEMSMKSELLKFTSEIARLWKPPSSGVPNGTICVIKFIISKDGEIEDFQIIQKSNVIIYDLSILLVAYLFKNDKRLWKFDKCLWGKSFVIDFHN